MLFVRKGSKETLTQDGVLSLLFTAETGATVCSWEFSLCNKCV